jgi:hypothetical protein
MQIRITWGINEYPKIAVEVIGHVALGGYTFSKDTKVPGSGAPLQYIEFEAQALDEKALEVILKVQKTLGIQRVESHVSIDMNSDGELIDLLEYASVVSTQNADLLERYATMETFLKEVQQKVSTGKEWLKEEQVALRQFVDTSVEKLVSKGVKWMLKRKGK